MIQPSKKNVSLTLEKVDSEIKTAKVCRNSFFDTPVILQHHRIQDSFVRAVTECATTSGIGPVSKLRRHRRNLGICGSQKVRKQVLGQQQRPKGVGLKRFQVCITSDFEGISGIRRHDTSNIE